MQNYLNKNRCWVKRISATAFLMIVLFSNTYVYAADPAPVQFKALEPEAPWTKSINPNDSGAFFQQIFNTMLAIAVTLAVIMIMYGGIKYMTTDAWTAKEEGKDIIKNAIWGLILALVSWLILYTINPDILSLRF